MASPNSLTHSHYFSGILTYLFARQWITVKVIGRWDSDGVSVSQEIERTVDVARSVIHAMTYSVGRGRCCFGPRVSELVDRASLHEPGCPNRFK